MARERNQPKPRKNLPALPHDENAEKGVLSSILINPTESMMVCSEKGVGSSMFWFPQHRLVMEAIEEMDRENMGITFISVTIVMRANGTLDQAGGSSYLTELHDFVASWMLVGQYADTVRDTYVRRRMMAIGQGMAEIARDEQNEIPELLAGAERDLLELNKLAEGESQNVKSTRELVKDSMIRLDEKIAAPAVFEMPTGILGLDAKTGGVKRKQLTVIAAQSTRGKTALAMNILENLVLRHDKCGGVIELEMSAEELVDRLTASVSWVDRVGIELTGKMDEHQADKLQRGAQRISDKSDKILICDDPTLTPPQISARLTTWKVKHNIDFAIIDHAQKINSGIKYDGRTNDMEYIARSFKPMAKKLDIALIVISQVTVDDRKGMSTKNSKALEEEADLLLTIVDGDPLNIWINKQRGGQRNVAIPVAFLGQYTRFVEKKHDD